MVQDRRKAQRIKQEFSVAKCSSKYLFEHNYLSRDISEDGICLLSPNKVEIGETVSLGMYLSGRKEPVVVEGMVVRRNESGDIKYPYLLGIQFKNVDAETQQYINAHIRYYAVEE